MSGTTFGLIFVKALVSGTTFGLIFVKSLVSGTTFGLIFIKSLVSGTTFGLIFAMSLKDIKIICDLYISLMFDKRLGTTKVRAI